MFIEVMEYGGGTKILVNTDWITEVEIYGAGENRENISIIHLGNNYQLVKTITCRESYEKIREMIMGD